MDATSDVTRMARARTPEIRIQRETDSHISLSPSPRGSPASSRGGTPERSSPKHVKGTRAKFIRQNPRFINSPICQMDPGSGGKSVAECLDWREEGRSGATLRQAGHGSPSHDSTLRQDYRPPSPDTRPQPLHRFSTQKPSSIPLGPAGRGREKISFVHQYDCRAEPEQQPEGGKLHGIFVWEPLPPSSPSSPAPPTNRQAPPPNQQTSHSKLFHSS
ncbi:Uncharacterized protein C2orf73 [Geodia barretti]|uniref:Uncharacterized protein C2orf73 n=1 Tax=Geodia barretti TaxID=519541 RepID=A0AA35RA75_GEOBA|nr:Uncharacterized protein C2orf73 [Geodia barretti]